MRHLYSPPWSVWDRTGCGSSLDSLDGPPRDNAHHSFLISSLGKVGARGRSSRREHILTYWLLIVLSFFGLSILFRKPWLQDEVIFISYTGGKKGFDDAVEHARTLMTRWV